MVKRETLYQHVISITADYLGPASQRFVDRQIQSHIGKEPAKLSRQDMAKFTTWSRIALSILTDDTALIDEYINRLERLNDPQAAQG